MQLVNQLTYPRLIMCLHLEKGHMLWWLGLLPQSKRCLVIITRFVSPFCVEFACSPRVSAGRPASSSC